MNEMNKPLASSFSQNSIVELLFAPLDNAVSQSEALFIEPRGNLVRKFDREELAFLVNQFARGSSATNLKRGSRVALSCRISMKAIIASFSNLLNGCVNVVLAPDLKLEEQLQALSSARVETLIVDVIEAALPILQNIKSLPQLRQIIVLSEAEVAKQPEIFCISWKDLMKKGDSQPDKLAALRQQIQLTDEAFLYFQHDGSNRLSGLMQTHKQVLEQLTGLLEGNDYLYFQHKPKWERMLSLAPFHHPHSFIASVLLPIKLRQPCMLLEPNDDWKAQTLSPRETLLISDASLLEEACAIVEQQITQDGGLAEKIWDFTLSFGEKVGDDPAILDTLGGRIKSAICRALLAGKLKGWLGGRLHAAIVLDHQPKLTASAFLQGTGTGLCVMHSKAHELLEQQALAN